MAEIVFRVIIEAKPCHLFVAGLWPVGKRDRLNAIAPELSRCSGRSLRRWVFFVTSEIVSNFG